LSKKRIWGSRKKKAEVGDMLAMNDRRKGGGEPDKHRRRREGAGGPSIRKGIMFRSARARR